MGPDGFCQTWHILVDPKSYGNMSEPSRPYPDDPSGPNKTHQDPKLPYVRSNFPYMRSYFLKFIKMFQLSLSCRHSSHHISAQLQPLIKMLGHFSTENLESYTKKPSPPTIGVNKYDKLKEKGTIDIIFQTRL